jgi:hypothetical protein
MRFIIVLIADQMLGKSFVPHGEFHCDRFSNVEFRRFSAGLKARPSLGIVAFKRPWLIADR